MVLVMTEFKPGDIVKCRENDVFIVAGFSKGSRVIPDGWLIGKDGTARNPEHCKEYEGAVSALNLDQLNGVE